MEPNPADAPANVETPAPKRLTASGLRSLLREGRTADAIKVLSTASPVRRAEVFLETRPAEQRMVLTAASPDLAGSILADCDSASLRETLAQMDLAGLAPALRLIPPDNLADILLRLPKEKAQEIESHLDGALLDEVRSLLRFDPETAGGMMTTRYLSVPENVTVARALEFIRKAKAGDTASYVYAVDATGRLAGTVPLRPLLTAEPRAAIRGLVQRDVVRLNAAMPRADIVALFTENHFASLPVADDKDRLIGIVTFDDVMAALKAREGEVARGMTGADPKEALQAALTAVRGRIPWITVTLIGGFGCAVLAAFFRGTLQEFIAVGAFVPVILALGESVASQTLAVTLSGLLGGDVDRAQAGRFVLKECGVGLLAGAYAGAAVGLFVFLWPGDARLAVLMAATGLVAVTWAACLGALLPVLIARLRVNPAVAGGPLVLAVVDVSTLALYLGGASWWMRG